MSASRGNSLIWNSDTLGTLCAVLLLLGASGSRLARPKPSDADSYHQRVRAAAATIPLRTGEWIAVDVPVPTEAVDELRPNVMISRRLRNVNTGTVTTLLFEQCRDVRDLAPHYPPMCYPGQGLTLTAQKAVLLQFDNLKLTATRYTFESTSFQKGGVLNVDNLMILPDGHFQPDMQGMERRIGADQRYFGAAEIQILHQDNSSDTEQTAASEAILRCYKPLVDCIANGVRK
jgi:hypothetical protein